LSEVAAKLGEYGTLLPKENQSAAEGLKVPMERFSQSVESNVRIWIDYMHCVCYSTLRTVGSFENLDLQLRRIQSALVTLAVCGFIDPFSLRNMLKYSQAQTKIRREAAKLFRKNKAIGQCICF
jgi:hypothetical protein